MNKFGRSTRNRTLVDWLRASYSAIELHSHRVGRYLLTDGVAARLLCATKILVVVFTAVLRMRQLIAIPGTRDYHLSSELRTTGRGTFTTCGFRRTLYYINKKAVSWTASLFKNSVYFLYRFSRVLKQGSQRFTIIIPECALLSGARWHNSRQHGLMPRFLRLGYE